MVMETDPGFQTSFGGTLGFSIPLQTEHFNVSGWMFDVKPARELGREFC